MHFLFTIILVIFILSFLIPLLGMGFLFVPVSSAFILLLGGWVKVEEMINRFLLPEANYDEGPLIVIRWVGTLIGAILGLITLVLKLVYFMIVVFPAVIGGSLHDFGFNKLRGYYTSVKTWFGDYKARWVLVLARGVNPDAEQDVPNVGLQPPNLDDTEE